jgi:hypothetical protein
LGFGNAFAIHEAVQALPGEPAVWQQMNMIPNLLLRAGEVGVN